MSHSHTPARTLPKTPTPRTLIKNTGLELLQKVRSRVASSSVSSRSRYKSAAVWAPGAADYLRDLIEIFEEYGWDWSYHAFRESPVWDVEMTGTDRNNLRPAADTDRKRVLLDAFRKNHRPAAE